MNPGMSLETLQPSGNAPHEVVITAVPPASDNGYTCFWGFGNGITKTTPGRNASYTYLIAGFYIISCTATENVTGMMYTASYEILVNPTPLVPESYIITRMSGLPSSLRRVEIGTIKVYGNSQNLLSGNGDTELHRYVDNDFKLWEERIQACYLLPSNKVYIFIKLIGLNEDGMENGEERAWAEGGVLGTDVCVDYDNNTFDTKMYYSSYGNYAIEQGDPVLYDTATVVRSTEMQEAGGNGMQPGTCQMIGNSLRFVRLGSWVSGGTLYVEKIDRVYKKQQENGRFHYIVLLKMTIESKDCFAWHNGVGSFFYNESYCSVNADFDTGYVITTL